MIGDLSLLRKPTPSPYPLNFCIWLHRNFDDLVNDLRAGHLGGNADVIPPKE